MDNDATLLNHSLPTRPKRVLPSRSRRGGDGVGTHEIDVMILKNAQLYKTDDSLIPADTMFVLKTNDTLEQVAKEFAPASSSINFLAHEKYFERPDVLKAYREQTIIETPEYSNVADVPSAGGRLRVRPPTEDNHLDADAVYEKRHRKYETFEKRQRLREKEKLKHEQYKLKERIEQLRGMDNSAFLAAPASSFSPRPGVPEVVEDDLGLNGNPAYLEGERRRKEMLMNAQSLEERYRVLLPPERQKKPAQSNAAFSIETESELSTKEYARFPDDGESEVDEDYMIPIPKKDTTKLKLKLPARPALVIPTITTSKAPSKKRQRSIPPPPRSPAAARRRVVGLDTSPLVIEYQIPPADESGPSSLHLLPNSRSVPDPALPQSSTDAVSSLRFMQYEPDGDTHQRPSKPPGRGKRKRAKTEERGLPSATSNYTTPPQAESYIVVDDEPPKRSSSPAHNGSPTYSFPPPPPPSGAPYPPSPETSVPPDDASPPSGLISRVGSTTPELPEYHTTSFGPPTPAADGMFDSNSSVPPPERIRVDRKPSVPPIESISAPVNRRGRSRGVISKPPRKSQGRRRPPCNIMTVADRTSINPRQLERSRHLMAFGARLPPILASSDSYDFELPPEVHDKGVFNDQTENPDISREVEGSQAPDDTDDLEQQDMEGSIPDPHEHLEAVDDDDSDQDLDGT
ncbi:hypothetical protein B0H15DRAFT_811479 [Mycena belliarum]|uniref:PEHE domain-containing protein n=1 Tax=Mycena belliarum TaxID=1033014 RepID=A0AAD6XU50_9AGAR|nr:hypothetical protein B0H15DRAFT_811479 [Mycena belliae]